MPDKNIKHDFEIGDVIECHEDGFLLIITGMIPDEDKLFVTDTSCKINDGKEYSVFFSEVTKLWKRRNNDYNYYI